MKPLRRLAARSLPGAALTVALLFGAPASARAQDQRALLVLFVNQVEKGEVLVVLRGEDILVGVQPLEASGLHGFAGARENVGTDVFVSLASLKPDIVFQFDERALTLRLTARPELLGANVVQMASDRPAGLEYRQDPSGFVNYAVTAGGGLGYDIFTDAAYSTRGVLLGTTMSIARGHSPIRGLTHATFDQRDKLRRIVAGDTIANGGLLGGGMLVGGVTVAREFSVDPYFVRYPSFNLSGAVTTPSTVEVYVNDRLVRTETLQPGQFDLARLPITSGRNDARLVLRDAFGGVRELASAYYLTTNVLARGLHEYSYSAGFERTAVGRASFDYGRFAFVGRHRVGLNDSVTLGGRLEARSDLFSGGPIVTARLPFGEVEAAGAMSRANGFSGGALSLAMTYSGRPVSLGAAVRGMSARYATVSLPALDDRPTLDMNAFVSMPIGPRATVTLDRRQRDMRFAPATSRTSAIVSARLSPRTDLSVNASWVAEAAAHSKELFVGITVRVAPTISAGAAYHHFEGASHLVADVQQPLPVGTGWGYRFHGEYDHHDFSTAALQYQGPYGRYELRHDMADANQEMTVSASGGVVAIGGGLYASRAVEDGYALIRVPQVAGVRAYASNQEIGRTDARGNLLIPNLLSYYGNVLNIADQDIPLNHTVGAVRKTIATPYRGGALVVFPVAQVRMITGSVRLVLPDGEVMPSYGGLTVTVGGQTFESPVGERGEFYFENLPAGRHPAVLEHKDISCPFTIELPATDIPVVNLGTITCTVARP